jgi:hypothetical protein
MKRLVWLLLLAFGTALAQVSPVDVRAVPAETCGCCEVPGACGMPDCLPAPMSAQPVLNFENPVQAVRVVVKAAALAARVDHEKFYARFLPRVSVAPVLPVTLALAPPASVPLFREHCSWLI